jgi:hypothetical protein
MRIINDPRFGTAWQCHLNAGAYSVGRNVSVKIVPAMIQPIMASAIGDQNTSRASASETVLSLEILPLQSGLNCDAGHTEIAKKVLGEPALVLGGHVLRRRRVRCPVGLGADRLRNVARIARAWLGVTERCSDPGAAQLQGPALPRGENPWG